ncbi:hypothetical protein F3Y22_tig00111161pilonHSYRG00032 [Hibiscus syriacus]|uniref:Uncharacterized protein n=1 Tax=Hibiscus syriacus TaxID=106335 RepID=A0A6A2YX43_HIBSY|nr:hypothetical protein F3Y22_tig00111161pilonHSYRG00032 [Hibiscus syriacus]
MLSPCLPLCKNMFSQNRPGNSHNNTNPIGKVTVKGKKENVWSIDNERAKAEKEKGREKYKAEEEEKRKRVVSDRKKKMGRVLVSAAMLMEVETVLQTQEPVIKPAWNTFASSVSGIWKGVGAGFLPLLLKWSQLRLETGTKTYMTATLGNMEESRVEKATSPLKEKASDEDVMDNEPGLVSLRMDLIPEAPLIFLLCLVKGCHKRLRLFIQWSLIMGVQMYSNESCVYEEEWVSPAHIREKSLNGDPEFDLKPFSQRKRTRPSELVGLWKVFEVSATPICSLAAWRVTSYVDVSNDGTLTIGVGWYSDEGINLLWSEIMV